VNEFLKNVGQAVNNSDYSSATIDCSSMLMGNELVVRKLEVPMDLVLKPVRRQEAELFTYR
jgi:hypothetical protein